jgi:predicted nucleotidyltransferase
VLSILEAVVDVAQPIRAVAPTLDGPVLQVLAGTTRPLTGREVHRLTGTGSPNGVRLVLARLTEQGLVHAEERAKAVFYVANREHLAWPAVEILTRLRHTLVERLRTEFDAWRPRPIHASLFGSAARGDGDASSDIDVLLIRPDAVEEDQSPWADQVDRVRRQVQAWTGNRCHAFQLDRVRLAEHVRAKDPLVDDWLRDGLTLAGHQLQTVLRQLSLDGDR